MQPKQETAITLPPPDDVSAEHSRQVAIALRELIDAKGGSISFGEFMQQALYAPGLGYYAAGARKFGAGGDFVTAPEVSDLFGHVVARQTAKVLRETGGDILEFGAGSGRLMVQVLRKLEALEMLPEHYFILEVSADLRQRQQQLLEQELPEHAARVRWLDGLTDNFVGVMLANEVADALPVERFLREENGVAQLCVAYDGDGFRWTRQAAPEWLARHVTYIEESLSARLPSGYVSELSPGLPGWIAELATSLERGAILLFDYGVSRAEYYAAERNGGWLRCHYQHRAHNDPLILPGIQDLTTWVDFTAVAEAAVGNSLDVIGYVNQSHFLLYGGLAEELAELADVDEATQYELSRQVKLLTLPGEMGEHFKCIGLSRGVDGMPSALIAADRSHRL